MCFFNIAISHLFNYFTLSIKTIVISRYLSRLIGTFFRKHCINSFIAYYYLIIINYNKFKMDLKWIMYEFKNLLKISKYLLILLLLLIF